LKPKTFTGIYKLLQVIVSAFNDVSSDVVIFGRI